MAGLVRKRNPLTIAPADFFTEAEIVRKEFGKLIHANPENIAIVPSASYGISTVTKNIALRPGEEIVVLAGQFPSNVYPWKRLAEDNGGKLVTVAPPEGREGRGAGWNQRILEAINPKTKVIALGHVHWADGTLFDLKAIRKRADEVGAYLVVDGTQSVGALPFNVASIKPDALVCAGYKWLMCPYSVGVAYLGDRFLNGKPIEENWIMRKNSEDFAGLVHYKDDYQPGARRFDMGEKSNFALLPGAIAALKMVRQWTPEGVQAYTQKITAKPVATLRENGWWIENEKRRGFHLFGLRAPAEVDAERIKKQLVKAKISVSFRGDAMRVSPHVYNTESEIWKLVEVLLA